MCFRTISATRGRVAIRRRSFWGKTFNSCAGSLCFARYNEQQNAAFRIYFVGTLVFGIRLTEGRSIGVKIFVRNSGSVFERARPFDARAHRMCY